MKVNMVMPKMGESITEGTVLKWLKTEGASVARDEIILEISTDKVDSEIPSPNAGVLEKILVPEGKTVEVGTPIAVIETEVGAMAKAETPSPSATPVVPKPVPEAAPKVPALVEALPVGGNGEKRFYSPLVRSIAEKEGVSQQELASIKGSGQGGRVSKKDIIAYLSAREARLAPPPIQQRPTTPIPATVPRAPVAPVYAPGDRIEIIEMDNMRRAIAEHMVRSVQTSPHVYSISEADVSHIVRFREAQKDEFLRKEGIKLTYTPFFIYAVAKALRDFPMVNASAEASRIIVKKDINIGMAVALDSGLIVPVVKNADMLNLVGMARACSDLADRARRKKLLPDEVQGGTFSVTNLGSFGNLYGTPIISQPQLAILGIGAIKKRVVVVNDAIAIRDMVYLSLGYDHRIIDGAQGGMFIQRIVKYLEEMDPSQV